MSEIEHPLNPPTSSGSKDPNSTLVEPPRTSSPNPNPSPKPTSIPAATPSPSSIPAPALETNRKPTIEFHSAAIGSRENARTKDYFAEQNQKTLTKKQAHSTRIRWLLILSCGLVGVVLLGLAVWWLANMFTQPKAETPMTPEEIQQTVTTTYDEAMSKINALYETSAGNETETETGTDTNTYTNTLPSDATIAEANQIFENAIASAVQKKDTSQADALRVGQMLFYANASTDYAKMLEIGEKVENINALDPQQQLQFYNIMSNAYTRNDNLEKAVEYYQAAARVSEALGGENGEGGI